MFFLSLYTCVYGWRLCKSKGLNVLIMLHLSISFVFYFVRFLTYFKLSILKLFYFRIHNLFSFSWFPFKDELSFNKNSYSILFIARLRLYCIVYYLLIRINNDDANANDNNKLTNIDSLCYRGICARKNRVLMRHTDRDITVNNIPRAIRSVLRHAHKITEGETNWRGRN